MLSNSVQSTNEENLIAIGNILDNSLNEIYIFELENLHFTYVNKGAQKNIGYTLAELKNLTPVDIKPEFDHKQFREFIMPLVNLEKEQILVETIHKRKDGSYYHVDGNLQLIEKDAKQQIVVVIIDITKSILTQNELSRSKEQFKRAEQIANLGTWEWDIRTDKIICSDQTYRIFGERPQSFEVTKETIFNYIPNNQHDNMIKVMKHAIKNKTIYNMGYSIVLKDGSKKHLNVWGDIVLKNGIPYKIYGVILDITLVHTLNKELEELTIGLKKRIEEEVYKNKKQASQIIQQSRFAQMGEMISMIAHQWRQPLASISAISGTLSIDVLTDNYDKQFFQERLDDLDNLSQHLSKTIDDFRNFFKEEKEKNHITLNDLFHDTINIVSSMLHSNEIEIIEEIENDVDLSTYINEVKQVILCILKNAQDAFIEQKNEHDRKIIIRAHKSEEKVILQIEDNAGGIPADIIDNIFNPYFSTKKEKDGTGLGLYMSKMIIEDNCKGTLKAQNSQNGAIITIELPINKEI